MTEHDTIRDSVNIYCEWLMALLKPKICTPKPVCEDPNRYARIIIKHLYSLFVPRPDSSKFFWVISLAWGSGCIPS